MSLSQTLLPEFDHTSRGALLEHFEEHLVCKDRNRGDDYVLIRVTPVRLEIVSYPHGLLNDPASWRPLAVEFP